MASERSIAEPATIGQKLWNMHWSFIVLITGLAAIGFAALYSVSGGSMEPYAERQIVRYCIGLGLLFAVALINIRFWMASAVPVYCAALALLLLVPVVGVENNGSQRWLMLAGISFQPSELMKFALVLVLARYYQWLDPDKTSRPHYVLLPLIVTLMPLALVMKQPDLGTALLFLVVGLGIMFLAGVSWLYFIGGATLLGAAVPFAWDHLHDYQRKRVLTFLDPEQDPSGAGYHILQSKIALGSGGVAGKGFLQGTQSQYDFLPEKHTDFIFPMFAEEMGFAGGVVLMVGYVVALAFLSYMGMRCRHQMGRLLCAGIGLILFVYAFINLAMVMGLAPVVGVPLPLVSYGGTAMMTMMFGFGLAMSAFVYRRSRLRR